MTPHNYHNPEGLDPEERQEYIAILLEVDTFNQLFPSETTYAAFGLNARETGTKGIWADMFCSNCGNTGSQIWLKLGELPHQGICQDCRNDADTSDNKE